MPGFVTAMDSRAEIKVRRSLLLLTRAIVNVSTAGISYRSPETSRTICSLWEAAPRSSDPSALPSRQVPPSCSY